MQEKKYQNEEPFFTAQGKTSFVKAKGNWLAFDKIHLSFVQHSGKPQCTQEAAIEGTMKIHGADGLMALKWAVETRKIWADAKNSRNKAAAAGNNYPEAVFTSIGGTPANRTKDGKCLFRQLSISPSSKSSGFVFQMGQCEGTANALGGFTPVKGAAWTRINVMMSDGDLSDFVNSAYAEYVAFRTVKQIEEKNLTLTGTNGDPQPADTEVQIQNEGSASVAPQTNQPPAAEKILNAGEPIFIVYDSTGTFNYGYPIAVSPETIKKQLHDIVKTLLTAQPNPVKVDENDYTAMVNAVVNGENEAVLALKDTNDNPRGSLVARRDTLR